MTGVDGVVVGVLVLWHFIGANTSDDGYILNMARVADGAGYMANYFRWFGVPEAPFGWYYDVLDQLARISTASPWMRLPTLIAAILCWMVISREVLPRLGAAVSRNRVALWTGGLLFLAFWLPYNNGLRPEPIIALGALLTWCSVERAIGTGRPLPVAIAVLIAAFSLAAGPTGLICIAALIAGSGPMLHILVRRARASRRGDGTRAPGERSDGDYERQRERSDGGLRATRRANRRETCAAIRRGYLPLLAPILAAGTVVLVVIFADQTLATVMEATRVRTAVGPNVAWFDERVRWDALLTLSPDGSLARRFGVFTMLLCLMVCVWQMLRKGGRIPGTVAGAVGADPRHRLRVAVPDDVHPDQVDPPLRRLRGPRRFAGRTGGGRGGTGEPAVAAQPDAVRSGGDVRARHLLHRFERLVVRVELRRAVVGQAALDCGQGLLNRVPRAHCAVADRRRGSTLPRALPSTRGRCPHPQVGPAPLTIAAAFVVTFEVLSLVKGAVAQGAAYSIAASNFRSLTGDTCGLANDVSSRPTRMPPC